MFSKIGSYKNFTIFTRKHLCWGLFLIKLQDFRPSSFLKRDFNTGGSCTKRYTNNSLLSRQKTIASLLELIDHVLSISEHVLEKHYLLSIFTKNLHKTLHK